MLRPSDMRKLYVTITYYSFIVAFVRRGLRYLISSGQATLPDSCPVCEHNPVSPDLCKPNKALRTTLKAFLRTEEKKREKDRPAATPAPPVETAPTQVPDEAAPRTEDETPPVSNVVADEPALDPSAGELQPEEPETLPQPSDQVCFAIRHNPSTCG